MNARRTIALAVFALLSAACGQGGSRSSGASDVYPAVAPDMPQVVPAGPGAAEVAANPVLVSVTYADDPNRASIDDFVAKIGTSSYWAPTTAEYGVGVPTTATVHLAANAPTLVVDTAIEPEILGELADASAGFPANAPGVIYLLFYPSATTITGPDGTACQDYGAYHWWTQGTSNGHTVAYAVIPTCDAETDSSVLQTLTISASHEIVEAVTDPYGAGYDGTNKDQGMWDLVSFGGEVGDMCEFVADFAVTPADLGYTVQRSWSNAAAAAGHSPCQPWDGVYANASPELPDIANIDYGDGNSESTKTVKIPVGAARTITLDVYSDGPTDGPVTVSAQDLAELFGGSRELTISLDRSQALNGEKVRLTVHVDRAGAVLPGGEGFFISVKQGGRESLWPVFVSN